MNKKNYAKIVALNLNGEEYLGLEIDQDIFKQMKFIDSEILEVIVSEDELTLKKTGVIYDGDR